MYNQSRYKYNIVFVSLLLFFLGHTQSKHTVVLPDVDVTIPKARDNNLKIHANSIGEEKEKSFFKFFFGHLPEYTTIESYQLKLYGFPDKANQKQTITILKGGKNDNNWTGNEALNDSKLRWADINFNTSIGRYQVREEESIIIKLNPKKFNRENTLISLAARSPEKEATNTFYSLLTSKTTNNFSKRPKLLLTYDIVYAPLRADWAQPYGNAQHSGFINWKNNAFTTEVKVQKLPNTSNDLIVGADPTGALVIYKNQPIIFTQSNTGTKVFKVKQLNANGHVLWEKSVDGMAKCWPLINEKGLLYYISVNGKLTVLNLEEQGKEVYSKSLKEATEGQISNINNNATIGYDNTLYLTSNEGIVAVSFPQFKVRWKYKTKANERNGTITLSEDESKAFFININTTQGQGRLVVLDNNDGTVLSTSNFVLGSYSNDGNYYIPAPVVQTIKPFLGAKYSRIFVLNGYDNSNKLFVFDVKKGAIDETNVVKSNNSVNTGISQPVIDGDSNVFFVYNGKMAKYDDNDDFEVLNASDYNLDNASILVADNSSNIYAIDPYDKHNSGAQRLIGFKYDRSLQKTFATQFNIATTGNLKKNLVLAPDGTLYTVTQNNVIAITPKKVSKNTIELAKLNTNTVYRATNNISVEDVKVPSRVNTILYSGGSISLKSGFSIARGSELTFKTGY